MTSRSPRIPSVDDPLLNKHPSPHFTQRQSGRTAPVPHSSASPVLQTEQLTPLLRPAGWPTPKRIAAQLTRNHYPHLQLHVG